MPVVAWRAGLDINPLDVTNDDDVRWLKCLLWPGEGDRAERLAAVIAIARRDPPPVHSGDLLSGLPALADQAPAEATLVIYHSSVLAYVDPSRRRHFADTVSRSQATRPGGVRCCTVPLMAASGAASSRLTGYRNGGTGR